MGTHAVKSLRVICFALVASVATASIWHSQASSADPLATCPGYIASNVKETSSGLIADLWLAGKACDVYGDDLKHLVLSVEYQTDYRLHVKIQDADNDVYQIPESVFPRPSGSSSSLSGELVFSYQNSPFSFAVRRRKTGEVLFDTYGSSIIFESQYLRLRTSLPNNPNLYGLGEHSDPFRLNTTDYIRTLWASDSYAIPPGHNLYGTQPVYIDHRAGGTHGVLFLNSNGMDIKINKTASEGQYLEYNTLGGVLDFYFFVGANPIEVSQQYALVAGLPAMVSYWNFGFHNCRYGYQDAYEVAEAVYNHSKAGIPLETMWTDIDYMDRRKIFTLDPDRFSIPMMRELVDHLHDHDQHYVMMVDPAVAFQQYPPYQRAIIDDVLLKRANGSVWQGVVWPGVTAFPDWFSTNIQKYWNNEFKIFFSPDTGVDIDGLWIDMNEPSDFACDFPCDKPFETAKRIGFPPVPPPVRPPPRPLPGFPCSFQPAGTPCEDLKSKKSVKVYQELLLSEQLPDVISNPPTTGKQLGLPGRDLLYPKYAIHNAAAYTVEDNAAGGGISNHTVNTNLIHQNGLAMYDTHNLFGTMMSAASRIAMLARRPTVRPFIITRSTFAGAGSKVGHWLGDNVSTWSQYRLSIPTMLGFTSIYQVPMTGSDICGHGSNATEQLCARWAMLGAFNPFYRNHNSFYPSQPQEFYRWKSVTAAAKKAIDARYRLLDYIYTAFYRQTRDGTPLLSPLFYIYPTDPSTFSIELQYFYGPSLLVSPITTENATSVSAYFPNDIFYSFWTHRALRGNGSTITLANQSWTDIPLHFRGGTIVPLRVKSAMTTKELRRRDFELVVAPGLDGTAQGELYLDDGESLVQVGVTVVKFGFDGRRVRMWGDYGFVTEVRIVRVRVLGVGGKAARIRGCRVDGRWEKVRFEEDAEELVVEVEMSLMADFTIEFEDDVL